MTAKIQHSIQLYLGGKFCDGAAKGSTQIIQNKWNGIATGSFEMASDSQLEQASAHAQQAFLSSANSSYEDRYLLIQAFRKGIELHFCELAQTIHEEAGKTLPYAEAEVQRALFTLKTAEALCLNGPNEDSIQLDFGIGKGKKAYLERFAVGPVLAYAPYNFPLNLAIHKIAPAWVAGAPVVLKPSPHTPRTAFLLARIFDSCTDLPLPKAMFQVVFCSNKQAEKWVSHPVFKVFTFTGSAEVGWHLKSLIPRKKVLLELGGNAPLIIDSLGSNPNELAELCVRSAYTYSGQVCIALQNVFVKEQDFEVFEQALVRSLHQQYNKLVSPMISKPALERFVYRIQNAMEDGAKVHCSIEPARSESGLLPPFYLISGLDWNHPLALEEAFAPVLLLHAYSDLDSVYKAINQGRFGLQAALISDSITKIKKAYETLEVGALIVNDSPGFRVDTMPYGGVKDSGFGREGVAYAYQEMTEPKLLVY